MCISPFISGKGFLRAWFLGMRKIRTYVWEGDGYGETGMVFLAGVGVDCVL